ncbi:unnamed protein product [Protopolystoma xenopodis]|uniref:Uncharacterized protein n=1 Tax=Protopolystoma xenopodis TaxID=117903 RepID=A0A3S5CKZ1_9PLAT|nr:unnamed protein product [Protopolystoma xenopodis]
MQDWPGLSTPLHHKTQNTNKVDQSEPNYASTTATNVAPDTNEIKSKPFSTEHLPDDCTRPTFVINAKNSSPIAESAASSSSASINAFITASDLQNRQMRLKQRSSLSRRNNLNTHLSYLEHSPGALPGSLTNVGVKYISKSGTDAHSKSLKGRSRLIRSRSQLAARGSTAKRAGKLTKLISQPNKGEKYISIKEVRRSFLVIYKQIS